MKQEPDSEKEVLAMPDAHIEHLLRDAYDVPPLPKSLLNRLDQAVAQHWGASPQLVRADPNWVVAASSRVLRSWRWPAAACLAAALLLAVTLRSSNSAYASSWAAVVEALSKQAIVQLGIAGTAESETSWLALSNRKLGLRSGNVERLCDLDQSVILQRNKADLQVKRFALSDVTAAGDPGRVALSFLIGDLGVDASVLNLADLRLVDESSSRVGDMVELRATFAAPQPKQELKLTLVVDPQTHLPQSCLVSNQQGTIRQAVLTYPRTPLDQWIAAAFPADLSIVDVAADAGFSTTLAAASTSTNSAANTAVESVVQSIGKSPEDRVTTSLVGAASLGWAPLKAAKVTDDAAVAEIDALLERLWRENSVTPVAPASDEELLRRVYLDLAGRTPTVTEIRNYLSDPSPDRYTALVDRLLASRDHATHVATVWRTFLLPEGVDLARFGGIQAFDAWLSEQFGQNVPYDRLVRELLLAEGRLSKSGPLLFYSALKLDADQLAGRTARVFLGMRLDCAQCHNDPFEPWTQQDFWSFAAFFARISRPQAALESVSTVMQVRDVQRGDVKMPDSEEIVPPKFLDGSRFDESPGAAARRRQLARWLTGPDNPYFARAAVNRVWAHLFGRGIVDPVDGFGKRYPPRSPELLDLLAGRFIAGGFDLRATFRSIALSRAYQLSSGSATEDPQRRDWFAQMNVKMLSAEQIYDCISVASMLVATQPEASSFSVARIDNSSRDDFLRQFQTLAGRATEYQAGIPQALTLMNGSLITSATDLAASGLLKSLEAPFFTDDQRIEVVYLATLSRRPAPDEWTLLREYVSDRDAKSTIQQPLADILWALLNSAEFTMNH